jgi:amidase
MLDNPPEDLHVLTCEDDAVAVHGMPISLQITGRRLQEEKVLAVTQRVLEALR